MGLTYYVRADGSDLNDGLGPGVNHAFQTVQHALEIATVAGNDGNKIWIAPGSYNEFIDVGAKYYNDLTIEGDSSGIVFGVPRGTISLESYLFLTYGQNLNSVIRLKNLILYYLGVNNDTTETCDLFLTNIATTNDFNVDSSSCFVTMINCTTFGSYYCGDGVFTNCVAGNGFWVGLAQMHNCMSAYVYPLEGSTIENHIYEYPTWDGTLGREFYLASGSPGISSGMAVDGYSPDIYGYDRTSIPDRGAADVNGISIIQCKAIPISQFRNPQGLPFRLIPMRSVNLL